MILLYNFMKRKITVDWGQFDNTTDEILFTNAYNEIKNTQYGSDIRDAFENNGFNVNTERYSDDVIAFYVDYVEEDQCDCDNCTCKNKYNEIENKKFIDELYGD